MDNSSNENQHAPLSEAFAAEYEEFERDVSPLRDALAALVEKWSGERCVGYDSKCLACEQWAAFDTLMRNPFLGPPPAQHEGIKIG